MKTKGLKISIFILLISVFACGFLSFRNNNVDIYAAGVTQDCYYLLGADGNPYEANTEVGTVDGSGKFVVGQRGVSINATAKDNFQIVGWQITYDEQSGKVQYEDIKSVEGSKTITLTMKDNSTTTADISAVYVNGYIKTSSVSLVYVFEDVTIRPIFDSIYYQVDVSELMLFTKLNKADETVDAKDIYYEEKTDCVLSNNTNAIKFTKAIVNFAEKYYYYDNIYKTDAGFFTIQTRFDANSTEELIKYDRGAFRYGANVEIDYDVDIDETDIKNSKNIDLKGVSISSNSVDKLTLRTNAEDKNCYSITQDNVSKRTTGYEFEFTIKSNSTYKNVVDVDYHNLYVADLKVLVDGNAEHEELNEILGSVSVSSNQMVSNISLYNFYSRTKEDNSQFLVKTSQDNGSQSFAVNCVENVNKVVEGNTYSYYKFNQMNGGTSRSQSFANVSQNFEIVVDYSSILYTVEFQTVEYVFANSKVTLKEMDGNTLSPLSKKRNEDVKLDATSVESVENIGFKFVGFATQLNGEVVQEINEKIDAAKPRGMKIYLCYEKIDYVIQVTNYNKIQLGNVYPIVSLNFALTNGAMQVLDKIEAANLTGETANLSTTINIDTKVQITSNVNAGLVVSGFSLKDPSQTLTEDDYFLNGTFTLDADFIKNNSLTDKIVIYVYEDFEKYEITYLTQKAKDNKKDEDVIMSNISVEAPAGAQVVKYKLNDVGDFVEIGAAETGVLVAKIVITELKLNDEVVLLSEGISIGEGAEAYTYVFNYFKEIDNNSTLSYSNVGKVYSHTETVSKDREICVLYSMPSTKVLISIDQDFATSQNFDYKYSITQDGKVLQADQNNNNSFVVEVGVPTNIKIEEIAYGYKFVGYQVEGTAVVERVDGDNFNYTAIEGINNIILKFSRIAYRFYFKQNGAGKVDEFVKFGNLNYTVLNIDNSSVTFEKPLLGYYVASVTINDGFDGYSSALSENNNYRFNEDILNYSFNLTKDQIEDLTTNYDTNPDASIVEVYVNINYLIFKYEIKLEYGLTNPKGDSRDDNVKFPSISLDYNYDGQDYSLKRPYTSKVVTFNEVPYGVQTTINVLSGAPAGFSVAGWRYLNDNVVLVNDYAHSTNHLTISSVKEDVGFIYKLTYNSYNLNVNFNGSQGNPKVYLNNEEVSLNGIQISLYDKLEIVANASRNGGYKFKQVKYYSPNYIEYVYDDTKWATEYSSLYIKENETYNLNNSNVYDETKTYYVLEKKENVFNESEMFVDESFEIADYALSGTQIDFYVEYELLQLYVKNTINETADSAIWKMTGRGSNDARIEFDLNDLALFAMVATDDKGVERNVSEIDYVTYNDVLNINVSINKSAKNKVDDKEYDLSLGLRLYSVQIDGTMVGFENLGNGEYSLQISVREFMPLSGQDIGILYVLEIQAKQVYVTTVVSNSTTFYENFKFIINARDYGFESSIIETRGVAANLSYDFQFLAKSNTYTSFKTDSYKDNFEISGVKIYCDGVLVDEQEYAKYGIESVEDGHVISRLMHNLRIVFKVQPILTYNGGPKFSKVFKCDESGNAVGQTLTIGSDSSFDIQVAELIVPYITIKYVSTSANSLETDNVLNCGNYKVTITFANSTEFDWLAEIQPIDNVTITITQREVYLTYDATSVVQIEKVYDGSSDWNPERIFSYLRFVDGEGLSIDYDSVRLVPSHSLILDGMKAYITSGGKDDMNANADENDYYNLYVYNFELKSKIGNDGTETNNFKLMNNDLIITDFIKITKRPLTLTGVNVYNKVYDGTDKAELVSHETIGVINKIENDVVVIDVDKLEIKFTDSSIGTNKKVAVIVNDDTIGGSGAKNYYLNDIVIEGLTIYPHSLTAYVQGYGNISILNNRGLTEKDKVDLIPLNATLSVEPIIINSQKYTSIYGNISQFVKGRNEYIIGYSLSMLVGGEKIEIDKNLHLSLPYEKNLNGVYFLTGAQAGKVDYDVNNDNIIIDLSQVNVDIDSFFLTQRKTLLKPWQIVLIVLAGVLVVVAAVLVFIIIRKRKAKSYDVHEKI